MPHASRPNRWRAFLALCAAALLVACGGGGAAAVDAPAPLGAQRFANPIVAAEAADPSVVYRDGAYWYCRVLAGSAIGVARAERLADIGRVPPTIVWTPPPDTAYSQQVWAPELAWLRGRWYIYFAASDGDNAQHRLYVLEGDAKDAQAAYAFKGRIATSEDAWAIDGTAFEQAGQLYFVWSGWRGARDGFPQVLFIARMRDPVTLEPDRHEIAQPDQPWEVRGGPLLEGPAVLRHDGRMWIAYSASGSWTDDYALGLLEWTGGDPLDAASWRKLPGPAFSRRADGRVVGPGHNAFVRSPDDREDWIVYHAIDRPGGGWSARSVRAQRFGWAADGSPAFGEPAVPGTALDEPSGTAAP